MNWLQKTPTELFKTIPPETLDTLVVEKQSINKVSSLSKLELLNQLMSRHILNKHHLPFFITTQNDLTRWLFCIYILE